MRRPIVVLLLAALVGLTGCDKARELVGLPDAGAPVVPTGDPTGGPGGPTAAIRLAACTTCHGAKGAPLAGADPLATLAVPSPSGKDPGAHRAHLVDGPFSRALECASCHLLPTDPAAHPEQRQGRVSFSRLATTTPGWDGGAPGAPVWTGTTCAGTYCHGAFKNGASAAPIWTAAGSVTCGACHGVSPTNGPGGTHPTFSASQTCGSCHGGAYTNDAVDLALHVNGRVDAAALSCATCHGDPARTPVASATERDPAGANLVLSSPPADAGHGAAATGAHLAHVNQGDVRGPGPLSRALPCTSCHALPTTVAHSNGTVGVTFGGLATRGGAAPAAYDFAAHTCASTYCHGAFPGGAGANALAWTGTAKLGCTSCHGAPPPANATAHHPPNAACATCHPGYTASTVAAATHVDGAVDHVPATGCTQCHGDVAATGVARGDVRAAPGTTATAVDAHGNPSTATTARGVGVHARHLAGTTWRGTPIACGECHAVPADGDVAHADGSPAVAFGALARTAWSGAPAITPVWRGAGGAGTLTCASTYCHGAFKNGASAAPTWTAAGSVTCGSCHAATPGSGAGGTHPTYAATQTCGACHGGAYTDTAVDPALHLDGVVSVAGMTCSGCHGDPARTPVASATALDALGANLVLASPPADAGHGGTGAHLAHVNQGDADVPGPLSRALACESCHVVPTVATHSSGSVTVVFGGLATARGATPAAYDFGAHGCASTYCHGSFAGGAGANPVAWTGVPEKLGCTSCHGAPPPANATAHHPPNPACGTCHPGYTAGTVAAATHVDGAVDHAPATGCTQCHGELSASAVPATDLRAAPGTSATAVDAHGNSGTSTGARGVGAHGRHLTGTTWRATPIACGECHAVPGAGDAAHANGDPAVVFGALARTAWSGKPAIAPSWRGAGGAATLTCASTYCHGAFENGANAAPTWTAAGSVTCGSCHAATPGAGAGGTHPTYAATQTCGACHGGAYTDTAVDRARHLNGALDVASMTCSGCHGDPARTPVASATLQDALGANLVLASPPADAGHGGTGAHLAHVNQGDAAAPGALSSALPCASCHAVPTSTGHSNGTVEVTFAGLATTGGVTPAPYDLAAHGCASTYCHGNFPGGAGANPIAWTGTTKLGCTACHGAPPGPTSATVHHPPNARCASCHAGYTATTVAVASHVNGAVEHAPTSGCTQCHGDLSASAVANTDLRAAPAANASAVDAHGNASTATGERGVGVHRAHLTGTTWHETPIACAECHAVPGAGDVAHADGNPAVTFGTLARTTWAGQLPITPVWSGANGGATLTCASTYCHGAFLNGASAAPTWTAAGSVTCGSCHGVSATNGPGGSHPTLDAGQSCGSCHGGSYTNAAVDPALHLNGVLDGGGESAGGVACSGCHAAVFAAMTDAARTSRHALGSDAAADAGLTWASPLGANAPASRSCVGMCHGDHPHDLTSPATATHEHNAYLDATSAATRANGASARIGVGGSGGAANRTGTDFDGTQAAGGLCASCHRNPIAAGRPVVGRAQFGGAAHDFVTNTVGPTTYAWRYVLHDGGVFTRDCTKCHASRAEGRTPAANGTGATAVHASDDASLLAGTKRPAGTAAEFVCYNCHGSAASPANGAQGDRSGKNIQAQIAKDTGNGSGHPAHADAVHDGAAEYAGAAFGNQLGVAAGAGQRHAGCLDCHDVHQARAGTHAPGTNLAGPPLEGAWGARLATNPAFWTAPGSANFAKQVIVAGTDLEATLCFKCHSAFYGALPSAPSSGSPGYAETDTAKEFNPANTGSYATTGTASWATGETAGGFHPVLASAGGNLGAVKLANLVTTNIPWSTTTRNLMTCSDCHDSDTATDPNGPHGSAAGFILRGPNTTWSASVRMGASIPAGTFCLNCHQSTFTNSRFTQHASESAHQITCWNCHARIPHGGPRPGMLVAPAGAATAVGGQRDGWDVNGPYAAPNATYRSLYLVSYPTTNASSWSKSNCGCNGTGHCLPVSARIATPGGDVPVTALRVGELVYTLDAGGRRIAAPIGRLEWLPVSPAHRLVALTLADGRVVTASAGHPLPDGTPFREVRVGAVVDGGVVTAVAEVAYGGGRTYDLLPEGPTGLYWADGVLLGSTLDPRFAPGLAVACR